MPHDKAVKQFVRNPRVRPLLGKAFETDCEQIDFAPLKQIWTELEDSAWGFPQEAFDGRRVTKEYVMEVRAIAKRNPELRELLNTECLEHIAAGNTEQAANALDQIAGLPVPFDLSNYREAILGQYGVLQLESLGGSKYEQGGVNYRGISLWSMFIAQDVRECQTYMPHDGIPKDVDYYVFDAESVWAMLNAIAILGQNNSQILDWLKNCLEFDRSVCITSAPSSLF
jgi:hypothetical protein